MKPIVAKIALSIFAVLIPFSLQAQEGMPEHNRSMLESEPYWHGFILLAVGAALGLIAQVAFELFRSWRRPKQQLSYQVATEGIIAGLPREIRNDIDVRFRGRSIDNLYRIQCMIRNIGRTTIRNCEIRMRLGKSGQFLDFSVDDRLLSEYDGSVSDDMQANGRTAYLKHFPPQGEVKFLLVVEGDKPHLVVSEVAQTDVEFRELSSRQLDRDAYVVKHTISIILLWMILPGISQIIPIDLLASLVSGLIHAGLLGALLPVLRPVCRILAGRLLARTSGLSDSNISVNGNVDNSVIVLGESSFANVSPVRYGSSPI